jgi:hypothetical protein
MLQERLAGAIFLFLLHAFLAPLPALRRQFRLYLP